MNDKPKNTNKNFMYSNEYSTILYIENAQNETSNQNKILENSFNSNVVLDRAYVHSLSIWKKHSKNSWDFWVSIHIIYIHMNCICMHFVHSIRLQPWNNMSDEWNFARVIANISDVCGTAVVAIAIYWELISVYFYALKCIWIPVYLYVLCLLLHFSCL